MPHLLLKDLPRYDCLLEASKEFPELDPSAVEAYLHLLRASDDVFGVAEHNLASHGISQGRFGVLMLLWRSVHPQAEKMFGAGYCHPRAPAELADAAGVTRATMTGLIDTLERDGFVKREPDPADRRMMSIKVTPKGVEFLHNFLPGHFRLISSLMATLTEAERKTLVGLLGKVQQQITALNVSRDSAEPLSAS
jgi:DNA-binding MarR family transcriptional regulator